MNAKEFKGLVTMNSNNIVFSLLAIFLLSLGFSSSVQAAENCSDQYYVDQTLSNGARWDMCWEHRQREGIVYHDVYYRPANGIRRKILAEASIAQIFVPYDDNGARYHDVSDYGLGGTYMADLPAAECLGGQRLVFSGKNVICQQIIEKEDLYAAGNGHRRGEALSLLSVTHVGAYNYIPQFQFFDDGTIEPSMGATGALQRRGSNPSAGWLMGNGQYGISHLHNYYWRLDFDLGTSATDDIVQEVNFDGIATRTNTITEFTSEAARPLSPLEMRRWRVLDQGAPNASNEYGGYEINVRDTGHLDVGPASEPWTFNDFYVTRANSCEIYASHNPTSGGCGDNLDEFVNGESIAGQDIIAWVGVTFHHVPRAEDEPRMHAHWNAFKLVPYNMHDATPSYTAPVTNQAPTLASVSNQSDEEGDAVSVALQGADADGDALTYSATGLPVGASISSSTGVISGTVTTADTYAVTVSVSDGSETASQSFTWTVTTPPPVNQAPTLASVADQSDEEGDVVNVALQGADADGDTLTYSASGLPNGAVISVATGVISGTVTTAGTYAVTVSVSDGSETASQSFTWTVTTPPPVNQAPTLASVADQTNDVGDATNVTLQGADADGDTLTYSATGLPTGSAISSATGVISGAVTVAGTYAVTVSVSDGSETASQSFTWLVSEPSSGCSDCIDFNATTTVSFSNQDQTSSGSITVEDGGDTLAMVGNRWRATNQTYNVTPNTMISFEYRSTSEGEIHGIGFDEDNGISTNRTFQFYGTQNWGMRTNVPQYTGNGSYQTITIAVGQVYTGSEMRLFFINDKDSGTGNNTGYFKNVRVYEAAGVNTAPTLEVIANQANTVGDTVNLGVEASDVDGDTLTYSATNLPTGLTINTNTGVISGTATTAGTYATSVTVNDGTDSVGRSLEWVINDDGGVGCAECLNFNNVSTVGFSTQDSASSGSVVVQDAGATLALTGNRWRATNQTFDITANTVVSFDYRSTSQGEIHGIGFDEDNSLSSNRIFRIHGTQNWGIASTPYTGNGSWQTITIAVGQTYTGNAMRMVFVNDKDSGAGDNTGFFRNVKVYEDGTTPPPSNNDLQNGETVSSLSGAQGNQQFYTVTPGAGNTLTVQMSGGNGDADLYVRYNNQPTTSAYDCRPYLSGNNETCTINNTQAGTYHIMVRAYSAYSGTSISVNY